MQNPAFLASLTRAIHSSEYFTAESAENAEKMKSKGQT
jgi:hypothetical protein